MVYIKRSEQFYKILKTLENDFISIFISSLEEDTISFIEIDSEDSISFVSETKIMNEYNNYKDQITFNEFFHGEKADVLWKKYRTKIRIGRYINRLLVDKKNSDILKRKISQFKRDNCLKDDKFLHLDRYVEIFVNNYKALYKRAMDKTLYDYIEFVSGESIRNWYLEDNYYKFNIGSLGNSCMRGEECQEYLDIYVDNPNICKLMIYRIDNTISIRALLWTLPNGTKYLDRIYSNSEADAIIFMNYAKEQGWDFYDKDETTPDIWIHTPTLYDMYPYMDTFKYLDMNTNKYYSKYRCGTYELEDTEGVFEKAEWGEY